VNCAPNKILTGRVLLFAHEYCATMSSFVFRMRSALSGLAVWFIAAMAMWALDGWVSLGSLAMLVVLAAALAALFLPLEAALGWCALAVLAFNWSFVPPRGTLAVSLHSDLLLLFTVLVVSSMVSWLVARQRVWGERAQREARAAAQLRDLSESLRDANEPVDCSAELLEALSMPTGCRCALLILKGALPPVDDAAAAHLIGQAGPDEQVGLWLCVREGCALGPGTGRYEDFDAWFLPMKGKRATWGAAVILLNPAPAQADSARKHAQSLCDQMGLALERNNAMRTAAADRERAQTQALRNTLLAAISHDYRTPLATIMGAASSLRDQADRLSGEQQKRLAATIVDETEQLSRMTDNTLQLARLDRPDLQLKMDWESIEEIVGTVLRRVRQRNHAKRVRARLEPGLPLLRCDPLLLGQLLDNLVDNALKYGDDTAPVEILATQQNHMLVLAVRDRGPRIPLAWRERIFEVFQRAEREPTHMGDHASSRGAGVGLAVCRAIARAHGGDLHLRARGHGGSSFECRLPIETQPEGAP
jgi:two-component system, OmpR family, sensor histidine kinase KdpD